MGMIRPLAVIAALVVLTFGATQARAKVVTLDFADAAGSVNYSNYSSQGFRFSPNCHWDTMTGSDGTAGIGWDFAGCSAPSPGAPPGYVSSNPDWLGPESLSFGAGGAWMYIDFLGGEFSLLELELISSDGRNVISSKGGNLLTPNVGGDSLVTFTGPEWRNIEWLLISGGSGVPYGIDNLVVQYAVPESGTVALVGAALFGLAASRRRRPAVTAG